MIDGVLNLDGQQWLCNCHDQLQRHKHYLNSGVGMTYQLLGWDDFVGDQHAKQVAWEYVEGLNEFSEQGLGVAFLSENYGTGKTFLGTLIIKAAVLAGIRSYVTTFSDMLSSMKAGWKDADYAKWYKNKVESAKLLMLDDVGKELMQGSGFNNDFAKQTLDNLIRTRAQQNRPTILTSNMRQETITQEYGPAMASLLNEKTSCVYVQGGDFRRNVQTRKKGERRIY